MNWINDRPEGSTLQNLALATMTGPAMSSLPKNRTGDVQYAIDKCESVGSGKQLILRKNPSAIAQDFFNAIGSPSTSFFFLPNVQFQCYMILEGTLGGNFEILAASGESTAPLENPFKTNCRTFSAPHLIREHGRWLCSGRKIPDVILSSLHLRRKKKEMRPIIHLHQPLPSFMIGPGGPPEPSGLLDREVRLPYHQDGLQLHHLLVIEKESGTQKYIA